MIEAEKSMKNTLLSKKDHYLLEKLGKKSLNTNSLAELQMKKIEKYKELFMQLMLKMVDRTGDAEVDMYEIKEIDEIYE